MKYPLSKYKFITNRNEVIALSTYAGRHVKGIAKADPRDKFDEEKGKALAAARCNAKIAKKRLARATAKIKLAQRQLEEARNYYSRMSDYFNDSQCELAEAKREVELLEKSM